MIKNKKAQNNEPAIFFISVLLIILLLIFGFFYVFAENIQLKKQIESNKISCNLTIEILLDHTYRLGSFIGNTTYFNFSQEKIDEDFNTFKNFTYRYLKEKNL